MGKLITVTGNSGVGKSTLVSKLCEAGSFVPFLEITDDRPFLQAFHDNRNKFSLANQVDFLLYQAETERFIRSSDIVGVQDGGLDECFHVFTRRFLQKGYLTENEYRLCERLYSSLRSCFPPPDLMIVITAPQSVIVERMRRRGREVDIERAEDLAALAELLADWLRHNTSTPTIHVDASGDDPAYSLIMGDLINQITARLNL